MFRIKRVQRISVIQIFCVGIMLGAGGCKKLVEVNEPDLSINAENVFQNDAYAASVLTAIYTRMSAENGSSSFPQSITSLSLIASLSADELILTNPSNYTSTYTTYYNNSLSSNVPGAATSYWNKFYPVIFNANSAIEGIEASTSLTAAVKQQLLGEAKFIRAFSYFYLVNLFGDVPVITNTDWKNNASLKRSSVSEVYQQIVADLNDAKALLSEKYLKGDALTEYATGAEERVRPTKWAALALLARVNLYMGDWANAESNSGAVINNSNLYDTVPLNNVFLKNNKEAIWQLQPVGNAANSNTGEGKFFLLPATGPDLSRPVYLSDTLVNSFETNDQRLVKWVSSVKPASGTATYYYPNKYKIGAVNTTTQEYVTVLRLAEQYLIRAEARTQQNKIDDAKADLNKIRKRAGLATTTANDKASLLTAIMNERKVEFFTEWGNRWFDLKRSKTIDALMKIITPKKGGTWETEDQLYPIPLLELQMAPQLEQNEGY